MGHQMPFDWMARKRRGSGGGVGGIGQPADISTNPYDQYFRDDGFPGFSSTWGGDPFARTRKRMPQSQAYNSPHEATGFFDYVPAEFRQYIPDNFGFTDRHPQSPSVPKSPPHQQRHPVYMPTEPAYTTRCDAAIQTDDSELNSSPHINSLNQHGLRNTVDMGQKSPPEEVQADRSQSAPPPGTSSNPYQFRKFTPTNFGAANENGFTNSGTNTTPQVNTNLQQPMFNQKIPQPSAPKQQHRPEASQTETEQSQPQPNQMHYQANVQPQETVRTIPIFIEGHDTPITPKIIHNQNTAPNVKPAPKQQHRPEPFTGVGQPQANQSASADPSSNVPQTPQTPLTTDCIAKIQSIQRDVLNLMEKVDKFSGKRTDKEFIHLDEMLTVNLLKLDDIDTNGRERIRMARKEAIKCIQASIAVLEAKAEQNTRDIDENGKMDIQNDEQIKEPEKVSDVSQKCEKVEKLDIQDHESEEEKLTNVKEVENGQDELSNEILSDNNKKPETHISQVNISICDPLEGEKKEPMENVPSPGCNEQPK